MDFEQAMKRLTEISELMGKSDLKLEDSMKLYTEALAAAAPTLAETMRIGDQAVVKKCKEYIKNAELQVQTLEASN